MFAPSYGEAFIGDASITDSIDAIRNKIGVSVKQVGNKHILTKYQVCSQEDILWPKLTAREHLELFGTLKRVPRDQLAASVDKHLQQVGLTFAADRLAVTFSGGMKRRLSVAISNLGNPAVIFLDEPTTGLDPRYLTIIACTFVEVLIRKQQQETALGRYRRDEKRSVDRSHNAFYGRS